MPDYSKTIIYKIQHEDNEGLIYVGSTTDFTKRKSRHKSNCSNPKHQERKLYKMIIDNGGWSCFKMIQIKDYPCNNKREAEAEEDNIMLELKAIMNDHRANRSDKQYREENKVKLSQQQREWYINNKEQRKQYCKKNEEKISQHHKKYYELNKEKLLQKCKQKVTCECGCVVTKQYLETHKKSKKHAKLLNETLKQ